MTPHATIVAATLLFTELVDASFHDSSHLQIQLPTRLFKAGGYEHRGALFGTPPYGATIMQPLYYADDNLCDPTVDSRKGYPERPLDEDGKMKPWPSPFILMVDRGECPFVQKVRNAQHAGAAGVLIADNTCLCTDAACTSADPSSPCEQDMPIMVDDGSGGDIDVPAFLLPKHDADAIKEAIQKEPVQVEMSWTLPTNERVEYELWTSPGDTGSDAFLKGWGKVAEALAGRTGFTPHQYLFGGEAQCVDDTGTSRCIGICTNNGKYCAEEFSERVNGEKVVVESLRRLCVWQDYGAETDGGKGEKYWGYVREFSDRCLNDDFFSSKPCVKDVYKHVGIDEAMVEQCMSDSGGTEAGEMGENRNTLLEKEIAAIAEDGIIMVPTISVNSMQVKGALTKSNVFDAICAGFVSETAPEICVVCEECGDKLGCIEEGKCKGAGGGGSGGKGVSKRFFGLTLLLLCSVFGGLAFTHWKKTRQDMRDHVRVILAEYMPLEGAEGGDNEGGSSPMDFAREGGTSSLL